LSLDDLFLSPGEIQWSCERTIFCSNLGILVRGMDGGDI